MYIVDVVICWLDGGTVLDKEVEDVETVVLDEDELV